MDGLCRRHGLDLERDRQAGRRLGARAGRAGGRARLPAQPPDRRAAAGSATATATPTPTRSPARRPGSTCACASPRLPPRTESRDSSPRIAGDRSRPAAHDRVRRPSSPGQKKLGLVIDLDTCVGCHACATACKEWNTSGHPGPLADADPYGAAPGRRLAQPRPQLRGRRRRAAAAPCTSHAPACTAPSPPASPSARPAPPTSAPRTASCWSNADLCIGCGLCAWACPYGARELDPVEHVMKKCTLCVDRIDNENPARGRAPARLRPGLPDPGAPLRRSRRPQFRGLAAGRRARRLRPDARARLPPGQPLPAAARAGEPRSQLDE